MDVNIRLAVPADAGACGRIMYEALKGINERHGFENIEVPTMESGCGMAGFLIHSPSFYVGYASAPAEWSANHGVAEAEDDMRALLICSYQVCGIQVCIDHLAALFAAAA